MLVQLYILQAIALTAVRTYRTAVATVAAVVHLHAVFVAHDVALTVADVYRENRGHADCGSECVAAVGCTFVVAVITVIPREMGVRHVGSHLQPLLRLIIGTQTGGPTFVRRAVDDTVVVEITERCVEIGFVGSTCHAHVVLLTERRLLVEFVEPVVRFEQVFLSVEQNDTTFRRIRVEFAVHADKVLSFRNGEYVVLRTSGVGGGKQVVGCDIRRTRIVTLLQSEIVIQCLIVHLIVFACTLRNVVCLQSLGVHAPLAVERNACVADLGAFGRNHDDAVGTARTIEGVRCGILQHRHRLDVRSVEVIDIAFVRRAVHHIQRARSGIHRTESADMERLTATRTSRFSRELHTGDFADKSIGNIRRLGLYQIIRIDYFCRTGKSLAFCFAEGNDNDIVDTGGRFFHFDVENRLSADGDMFVIVADERYD